VALMPIKVNAGARRQGTECPRRVRLDAGLSGGIGRVGIGSLGVLGLLARGMRFDVLFFCFFFEPTNLGAGLGYPYSRALTDITHSWNWNAGHVLAFGYLRYQSLIIR
jgi:hypothetical protein